MVLAESERHYLRMNNIMDKPHMDQLDELAAFEPEMVPVHQSLFEHAA